MGCPRCTLPEPWFWVCKVGREGSFLVNWNQVTCTSELVPTGPLYPGGASRTPETQPSWELSSGEITRVLKERSPATGRLGSPTRRPPYPADCPAAEVCQHRGAAHQEPLHAHGVTGPPPAPPPGTNPAQGLTPRRPELPRDRRARHPGAPRPPPGGPGQQPRRQGQGTTGDRCAWPAAACTRGPSVLESDDESGRWLLPAGSGRARG